MTTFQFVLFTTALIVSLSYQRIKFALNRKSFERINFLRRKTGLDIHHGHWGLIWVFVSLFLFMFDVRHNTVFVIAGIGSGLLLDEVVPLLKMPSHGREIELNVYSSARNKTFIVVFCIVLILSLVFLLSKIF